MVRKCISCLEEVNNPLKDYNKQKALNKLEKTLDYDPMDAPNVVTKEMSRV